MPDHNDQWLVGFDTDRIKDYIFATNNLKEIRGASALLVEQDEQRKALFDDTHRVYAAGGGGAGFIESESKANELVQHIEREFREAMKTGTITAEYAPPSLEKWFGRRMVAMGEKLKRKKTQKGELGLLPVEPYMRLCDSCGHQPAGKRLAAEIDPSGDLLCESCARKRERGGEERREGFAQRFLTHVRSHERWQNPHLKPPRDLNALGDLDDSGYVGFVMIDGNRMGKLLELMAEPKDYTHFSTNLAATLEKIVFEALANGTKPIHNTLPFEIVLIGGDDLMIFTTAGFAIPFTLDVLRRFEKDSHQLLENAGLLRDDLLEHLQKEFGDEQMPIDAEEPFLKHKMLTMAAGVVICHPNFPIPALVEIASSLLKNAKRKCAEGRVVKEQKFKYEQSAVDFQVVTGSAMDLEMARATVPHCRPYWREDLERLWQYAMRLYRQNLPPTQLQTVYHACHAGFKSTGTMATLHMLARLNRQQRDLLKNFFISFRGENGKSPTQWPWRLTKEDKKLRTAFVDLIDLYGFV